MKNFTIYRTTGDPISFYGDHLASVIGEPDVNRGNRQTTLNLYRELNQRYISEKIVKTNSDDEFSESFVIAMVLDATDSVIEFFGHSSQAQELYQQVGIPYTPRYPEFDDFDD